MPGTIRWSRRRPVHGCLDPLIALGCRKFLAVGSCGTLVDIKENDFLIPTRALRDEGTFYKYLPASRYVDLDPVAVEKIGQGLKEQGLPFEPCTTWTTDGFFRETQDMVEYRCGEGCQVVEMECASMAAVAAKRGAEFGQLLYTADSLANVEAHDDRDWGQVSQAKVLHICLWIIHNF
ncbi:nucleoside phosphorylase [Lactobacillus delbrueckii]|nr:nucleoside phosphorylase [Lactobacillus delbrueckii subsp. sunkii]MCZ0794492.1 nucleoside phosphorylase [Lactobacillus delbrueckii]